jgi:hypothetical protein
MKKIDGQLAAFITGLLLGLMIIRRVTKRVVELDIATERQRVGHDGKSAPTPAAKIELVERYA